MFHNDFSIKDNMKTIYIKPETEIIVAPEPILAGLNGASDGNGTSSNFNPETTIGTGEMEDGDFAKPVNPWNSAWED